MRCPICSTVNAIAATKSGVAYRQCASCHTIYSVPLDQAGKVGGCAEEERRLSNKFRLECLSILGCRSLLDFGCGHGYLVESARSAGFEAKGYDRYGPPSFSALPERTFAAVTMVEVVEHLHAPFDEFDTVRRLLEPNGCLLVETSFSDFIAVSDSYVDPELGHNTVFSHEALDSLLDQKEFTLRWAVNRNVRIYSVRCSAGKAA